MTTKTSDLWRAEGELVEARLAHWTEHTATSSIRCTFETTELDEFSRSMRSSSQTDVGAPMGYSARTDRICIDPVRLFGEPGLIEPTDPVTIRELDGTLLHELGHRRDRRRIDLEVSWAWTIGPPLAVCMAVSLIAAIVHGGETDGPVATAAQFVFGVLALIGVIGWVIARKMMSSPARRRALEDRADDYAVDVGGIDVWHGACDYFDRVHVPDRHGIYRLPIERRERQAARLSTASEE